MRDRGGRKKGKADGRQQRIQTEIAFYKDKRVDEEKRGRNGKQKEREA